MKQYKMLLIFIMLMFMLTFLNIVESKEYIRGEILVFFRDDIDLTSADRLINETYNLTWLNFFPEQNETGYKMGLVKVPAGEEQKWINLFETNSIVRYANFHWLNEKVELEPPSVVNRDVKDKRQGIVVKSEAEFSYMDYLLVFGLISIFVLFLALLFIRGRRRK